jgi:hypothetical protein
MTRNTIFVAADNPAKRKELEENVIKAFYLSNLSAPTELQDLVNTLRSVLDVNRVQQLASQEAIVSHCWRCDPRCGAAGGILQFAGRDLAVPPQNPRT